VGLVDHHNTSSNGKSGKSGGSGRGSSSSSKEVTAAAEAAARVLTGGQAANVVGVPHVMKDKNREKLYVWDQVKHLVRKNR
jgi:hypothetical protein